MLKLDKLIPRQKRKRNDPLESPLRLFIWMALFRTVLHSLGLANIMTASAPTWSVASTHSFGCASVQWGRMCASRHLSPGQRQETVHFFYAKWCKNNRSPVNKLSFPGARRRSKDPEAIPIQARGTNLPKSITRYSSDPDPWSEFSTSLT